MGGSRTKQHRRVTRRPSHGAQHVGRGGTGNVFKGEEAQAARDEAKKAGSAVTDDHGPVPPKPADDKGWAEKGKDFLFGHKK